MCSWFKSNNFFFCVLFLSLRAGSSVGSSSGLKSHVSAVQVCPRPPVRTATGDPYAVLGEYISAYGCGKLSFFYIFPKMYRNKKLNIAKGSFLHLDCFWNILSSLFFLPFGFLFRWRYGVMVSQEPAKLSTVLSGVWVRVPVPPPIDIRKDIGCR